MTDRIDKLLDIAHELMVEVQRQRSAVADRDSWIASMQQGIASLKTENAALMAQITDLEGGADG